MSICGAVLLVFVLLGACSTDGGEQTSPNLSSQESSTTDSPTSSDSTSITTVSTSLLVDEVEQAVREAHTRYMVDLYVRDDRVTGPEARLELAEELTVDPQLTRIKEVSAANRAAGILIVGPGYDSNIVSVEIDGATAVVSDCSQDRSVAYDVDGNLTIPMDDFYKIRMTNLVLVGGVWKVELFLARGEERCDPDE